MNVSTTWKGCAQMTHYSVVFKARISNYVYASSEEDAIRIAKKYISGGEITILETSHVGLIGQEDDNKDNGEEQCLK